MRVINSAVAQTRADEPEINGSAIVLIPIMKKPVPRISFSPIYLSAIYPAGSSKTAKGINMTEKIMPIVSQLKPRIVER